MGLIPILTAGYIVYLHFWESSKGERAYVSFFDNNVYLIHLSCAIVVACIGFFFAKFIPDAQFMFSPLVFLILFKPADLISLAINKRHIMLTRMSRFGLGGVEKGQKISDFALDLLITGLTFLMCILIHVILPAQFP